MAAENLELAQFATNNKRLFSGNRAQIERVPAAKAEQEGVVLIMETHDEYCQSIRKYPEED